MAHYSVNVGPPFVLPLSPTPHTRGPDILEETRPIPDQHIEIEGDDILTEANGTLRVFNNESDTVLIAAPGKWKEVHKLKLSEHTF